MPPPFRLLIIILLAFGLSGCDPATDRAATVEFWAMGQEGEQVRALLPEFERLHPDIRVRVQQIPWSAAHEKLLTAYAGDSMPDAFQLGNTWIPEFVALRAIEPLDERLRGWPEAALADFFPGILATNRLDDRTYALPWYVDTRLFFYRTDLLSAAGFVEPPATWDDWLQAMVALKGMDRSGRYAILLPINEWQLPVILALQRGATLLRDRDQYGDFQNPRFREAFAFYLNLFEQGLAPPVSNAQMANLYQEFAKGTFAVYASGPWNIGEFGRRLPAAIQAKWMTAALPTFDKITPLPAGEGPEVRAVGLSLAGGASLALSRTSPRREAAWKLLEFLAEAGTASAVLSTDRRSAGPAIGLERSGADRQPSRPGIPPTVAKRAGDAADSRMGAHRQPHRLLRRTGGAPGIGYRCGPGRVGSGRGSDFGKTALAAGAGTDAMIGPERHAALSAWTFLAPALLLIAVFFFLPVLAALLLSFTDFDIYALGDLDRLRFVGFANYLQLLQSPLFWTALGNTFYFVVVGGPLSVAVSLGAALLVNSRLTRFPGFFRAALLLCRWSPPWWRWRWCGAISTIPATAC
jgi:multiple sugar transport system substrate-binding protein